MSVCKVNQVASHPAVEETAGRGYSKGLGSTEALGDEMVQTMVRGNDGSGG
jgi:hypothetical protein